MYSLTQGTIITGVRSDKYSNIRCNGVVISARCDLANCKISKIYYLIAVPSDDWLLSDEGFNIVLSQRQNDLEDKLQTKLGGSGLDWSTLKSFSVEEIWRRERRDSGFDYIFVDEMHLFNINEQHVFHYLTKSAEQKQIPICFALDYGQAIGDRGNTNRDYIETAFGEVERNDYKTVFRCSPFTITAALP